VSLSIFGDAVSDLPSTNHALGRPVHVYDTAGRVTLTYDLKGRVTAQTRTALNDVASDKRGELASQSKVTFTSSGTTTLLFGP